MARVCWMDQTRRMHDGDRMLIPCQGGPTGWRAATFPPPLEFETDAGTYVLIDDGAPNEWSYAFVAIGVRP